MTVNVLTGAIVTVALFMLGHLITAVWWASKVTTLLDGINRSLADVRDVTKDHSKTFFAKEEAERHIKMREAQIKDIYQKIACIQEEQHRCQLARAEWRERHEREHHNGKK